MTSGWLSTASGVPLAMTRPRSIAMMRSATDAHERDVVLDDDQAGAGVVADPAQERGERFGLALGDAAGRFVEEDHRGPMGEQARQVDDATGAGRELTDELRRVGVQAEQLDELGHPGVDVGLAVERPRQAQRGRDRVAHLDPPFARDRDRLLHRQAGEEAGVLEGPAQPGAGPAVRAEGGDVGVTQEDLAAVRGEVARQQIEERRLAGAVGADDADDLAAGHLDRHVVDGPDATEADRYAVRAEADLGIDTGRPRRPPRPRPPPPTPAAGRSRRAARWRKTARSRSVRPRRSAAGPWNRTSPFSRNTARSATARATSADCSTSTIVHPAVRASSSRGRSWLDDEGGQPEGQLVDEQQPGTGEQRHGQGELLLLAAGQVAGRLVAATLQARERSQRAAHRGSEGGAVLPLEPG